MNRVYFGDWVTKICHFSLLKTINSVELRTLCLLVHLFLLCYYKFQISFLQLPKWRFLVPTECVLLTSAQPILESTRTLASRFADKPIVTMLKINARTNIHKLWHATSDKGFKSRSRRGRGLILFLICVTSFLNAF